MTTRARQKDNHLRYERCPLTKGHSPNLSTARPSIRFGTYHGTLPGPNEHRNGDVAIFFIFIRVISEIRGSSPVLRHAWSCDRLTTDITDITDKSGGLDRVHRFRIQARPAVHPLSSVPTNSICPIMSTASLGERTILPPENRHGKR